MSKRISPKKARFNSDLHHIIHPQPPTDMPDEDMGALVNSERPPVRPYISNHMAPELNRWTKVTRSK